MRGGGHGVAGMALSGGIGWLRRKHGLSVDNLIEAEVVTAGGEVVPASEGENEDLLWALRGGGGNFGVVTALTYRAHPIGPEPSHHATIDVWFQGGAMAEVGETETAFANRGSPYLLGIEGNWEDAPDDDVNVAWVRETVEAMKPYSDGGSYLNFPGFLEEGEELLRAGYGANYERLAEVKAKYDPGNLFRLNPNVRPAG